jgi:hypothetical protein
LEISEKKRASLRSAKMRQKRQSFVGSEEGLESNMSPIRVVINDFMSKLAENFREFAKTEEDDGKNPTEWHIGACDDEGRMSHLNRIQNPAEDLCEQVISQVEVVLDIDREGKQMITEQLELLRHERLHPFIDPVDKFLSIVVQHVLQELGEVQPAASEEEGPWTDGIEEDKKPVTYLGWLERVIGPFRVALVEQLALTVKSEMEDGVRTAEEVQKEVREYIDPVNYTIEAFMSSLPEVVEGHAEERMEDEARPRNDSPDDQIRFNWAVRTQAKLHEFHRDLVFAIEGAVECDWQDMEEGEEEEEEENEENEGK